jgi:hypothetical protein
MGFNIFTVMQSSLQSTLEHFIIFQYLFIFGILRLSQFRLALNLWSSCLSLPSGRITGLYPSIPSTSSNPPSYFFFFYLMQSFSKLVYLDF